MRKDELLVELCETLVRDPAGTLDRCRDIVAGASLSISRREGSAQHTFPKNSRHGFRCAQLIL